MSEPSKITSNRTKSVVNLAEQMNRMWSNPGLTDTRRERIRNAYLQYQNNMLNSPAMRRAVQRYGERNNGSLEGLEYVAPNVSVPRSQYMKRRNNRK